MDNFIDKLAQKFTAQEIIKANASAEAQELQRTREQVQQYETYLQEMKQVNDSTKEALAKLEQTLSSGVDKISSAQVPTEGINTLIEESMERIRSAQESADRQQSELEERLSGQIQQLQSKLVEQLEEQSARTVALVGQVAVGDEEDTFSEAQQNYLKELSVVQLKALKELSVEQLISVKEQASEQLISGKELLDAQKEELIDFVHKENVKVYRNVQAVIVDELNKQTENMNQQMDKLISKSKSIMGIAVTSLIFSILSVGAAVYFLLLSLGILSF